MADRGIAILALQPLAPLLTVPARLRDLARALEAYGVKLEELHGKHNWRFVRGAFIYPVPAHNGLKSEISDVYVNGAARAFSIEKHELWAVIHTGRKASRQ